MNTVLNKIFVIRVMVFHQLNYTRSFVQKVPEALRSKKSKSSRSETQYFSDSKYIRTIGGKGGDGCISFLQLWANERAGPDGGDGGNGGHVIFEASNDVKNFNHVTSTLKGDDGEKGFCKDCHGKSASHTVVKVPIGTIVKNENEKVVGDLLKQKFMFIAARGGSGGRGNRFFVSDIQQAPQISEYGASGEDITYQLELRTMAHIGFIGLPNAGKSSLLRAISRAKPKIAPYAFTTLRPYVGMVLYDDHEQVAVADLPGLISGSHKNKGLGIQFLKHAERCATLMFVLNASSDEPWKQFDILMYELKKFNPNLIHRRRIIVANKIDLPEARNNISELKKRLGQPVIGISAKLGTNLSKLLREIRIVYDECVKEDQNNSNCT